MDEKVYLNLTSKTLIEIWSGGNDNPEATVLLDESTKKYIHVTLKQISFSYENDKESRTVKEVPVGLCGEESFKTDYEK